MKIAELEQRERNRQRGYRLRSSTETEDAYGEPYTMFDYYPELREDGMSPKDLVPIYYRWKSVLKQHEGDLCLVDHALEPVDQADGWHKGKPDTRVFTDR